MSDVLSQSNQTKQRKLMQKASYEIGETVWSGGDEVTITSEPYELHGGTWQNGVTASGQKKTVITPLARAFDVAKQQTQWKEQQAAFSRINKST